jgi:hypothetical protein
MVVAPSSPPAAPRPSPGVAPRTVAPPGVARGAAPQPATVSPVTAAFQDERALRHHWEQLRGRGELPLAASLDSTQVAANWPNTLMVSYSGGDWGRPQIARLGRHTYDVEYTSMVTEWILSCSREVARLRKPTEKEDRFPGEHRRRSYHMLLLPFASAAGASDHILCHLTSLD